jgi:alanine-glyoxylate transaminase/serine-glyoxylate transaminase/serine-pyruvate transaminase
MKAFQPPERILLGPGPSNMHPRVLAALARPPIGHLDPEFIGLMDEIQELLRYAFQTANDFTFVVSGPGSLGMETALVNLIEAGTRVMVLQNGFFGGRLKEIAERYGAKVTLVEERWGRSFDPEKLREFLQKHPDTDIVAFVHAETSTGALSDARALVEIAHEYDCLTVVDTVTSLGGCELLVDQWGIDVSYSGSQKCFSGPPGLSPITFNKRAVDYVKKRRFKVHSWFMDITQLEGYWMGGIKRSYHHTAPINSLYGLHEALLLLHQEGLVTAWDRHLRHHRALLAGLNTMGLGLLVPPGEQLPQLNAVLVPDGIDEALIRSRLLNEFGIEIGGGLGQLAGRIWRIGLMGESSRPEHILRLLATLEVLLQEEKLEIEKGTAEKAAQGILEAE